MLAPGADTEALAYQLNRPGIIHTMQEQRDSAKLVRMAYEIIHKLAPVESQILCMLKDLESAK
jgi:hypothetical protein